MGCVRFGVLEMKGMKMRGIEFKACDKDGYCVGVFKTRDAAAKAAGNDGFVVTLTK